MEVKIDAKCPRCGANIQFHHISDVANNPCDFELLNKVFDIGRSSSLSAARKMKPEKSREIIINPSARHELMDYINNLFVAIASTEGKEELLKLRKQVAKSKLVIKKNIANEFREGKNEALKEIDARLKDLSKKKDNKGMVRKDVNKKKDRKGLVYRGIFDEANHQKGKTA